MVIGEDVFAAAGVTISQLAELLVANETASLAGEVENVICCERLVELRGTVVRLGVTVGAGVPVATRVALERLKLPELLLDVRTKLTVPEVSPTDGIAAGTAVIMYPFGMVAIAFSVASPARSQLLIARVSAAPTLSVKTTDTGGVDVALQLRFRPSTAMPIVTPL
jgi:hypothetical protein